jgi:hypothetical protein
VNFIKLTFDGPLTAGSIVEVTLSGVESDVFLVDPSSFRAMESGRQYQYHGGHFKNSPVRLSVPHTGEWIAVVVPGAGGTVRASARAIPT